MRNQETKMQLVASDLTNLISKQSRIAQTATTRSFIVTVLLRLLY